MASSKDGGDQVWHSRSHPVEEDMGFQRKTWAVERVGWLAMAAIVVLALLGLFSNGLLSSATASDGSGHLRVDYDRFHRHGAASSLQLRVDLADRQDVRVRFDPQFLQSFKIDGVSPRPAEEYSGPAGIDMVFRSAGNGPLKVYLSVTAQSVGPVWSVIGIPGESPARLTQFIFP